MIIRRAPFLLIPFLNIIGRMFYRLSDWSYDMRNRFTFCPCCGENTWYGKACYETTRRNPRKPDCGGGTF